MKHTLYWLDGMKEEAYGDNVIDAVTRAGYDGGAIRALDFYSDDTDQDEYVYNKTEKEWQNPKLQERIKEMWA